MGQARKAQGELVHHPGRGGGGGRLELAPLWFSLSLSLLQPFLLSCVAWFLLVPGLLPGLELWISSPLGILAADNWDKVQAEAS